MCVFRMTASGVEVLKPLLIWLHDPEIAVPEHIINEVVGVAESWLIRRQLCRLPSGDMGRLVANLIRIHRSLDYLEWPERVRSYFAEQNVTSAVWPGDAEVREALQSAQVYGKIPRQRLRMFLLAIEDAERAYGQGQVRRLEFPIEHLMPQAWETHWLVEGLQAEIDRQSHVHRLGNLTLLTSRLNSAVSNGPWLGDRGKRKKIIDHDVLVMNKRVCEMSADGWDEAHIDIRTTAMIDALLRIWSVPEGHVGVAADKQKKDMTDVGVRQLVAAGLLPVGTVLTARPGPHGHATAVVTEDGGLEVTGIVYESPSAAGSAVRGGATNGWEFWRLADGRRLRDVRAVYQGNTATDDPDDELFARVARAVTCDSTEHDDSGVDES
jgi:hypothetical protein